MTPLITPVRAWLARTGVESRINKTNTNNQVRVTWEKKEKQTMNSITKPTRNLGLVKYGTAVGGIA